MNMSSWGLRCAPDSELAAAMVKHSVATRVTSPDYSQFVNSRRVLHRLRKKFKACDVVVNIWISIETGSVVQQYVECKERVLFSSTRKSPSVLWVLIDGAEHPGSTCRTTSHR